LLDPLASAYERRYALKKKGPDAMERHRRIIGLLVLLAGVSLILIGGIEPVHGATVNWSESSGGDYETPTNWTPKSPVGGPIVSDDVVFNLPDSYTVAFNSSPTNKTLSVPDGEVTFVGAGLPTRIYTLNESAEIETGRLTLGDTNRPMHVDISGGFAEQLYVNMGGQLDIDNGSLSNGGGFIGSNLGAISTVTVGGTLGNTAAWTNRSHLYVGYNSKGVLSIHDGGQVSNTEGFIAHNRDSTGTVTVEDAGSSWTNSGNLSIGGSNTAPGGTGELNVTDGSVSVTDTLKLWPGSSLNLSGGQVTAGSVDVADGGQMNLTGGTLTVDGGTFSSLAPGISLNGSEAPTLDLINGATASYSGEMMVAYNSEGTLNINSGSTVTTGFSTIAHSPDSVGLVVVDNGTWTCSTSLLIAPGGIGELEVTNGGVVSSPSITDIAWGTGSDGAARVDNSTLDSSRLLIGSSGHGELTIVNGGLVTSSESTIGSQASGTAQVTVDGGTWAIDDMFVLGQRGQGTLSIENGGQVSNVDGIIGGEIDSAGEATVRGSGSTWTNRNLYIGGDADIAGGNAGVTIANGGTVNVTGDMILWYTGALNISGGTLRFSVPTPFFQNGGMLNYANGTVEFDCDLAIGGAPGGGPSGGGDVGVGVSAFFGWPTDIPTAKHLSVTGEASLLAPVTLSGGTFSAGSLANAALLQFDSGTFNLTDADLSISLGGLFGRTLEVTSTQNIAVTNNATIDPTGLLLINGGAFGASTTINQGEIRLTEASSGSPGLLAGSAVTNEGLLSGNGRISANLHNAATGLVDVAPGDQLMLTGSANVNHGTIVNSGGTFRAIGTMNNEAGGNINANGNTTLSLTGGLDNSGRVTFTAADAYAYGDITNNGGGLVGLANASTATFVGAFINNGDVYVGSDSRAAFCGPVSGSGNFPGGGTIEFVDGFSPGASPATISFGGDVLFSASALLAIELGGTVGGDEYDRLNVAGDLTLGGTLQVSLIYDFAPDVGDTFDILDWGVLSGAEFDAIELPDLAGRKAWDTSELYSTGAITVIGMLDGDTDIDWDVDSVDYGVFVSAFGDTGDWRTDFNEDGRIDLADFVLMRKNFGISAGASPGSNTTTNATPEPTTLGLLAIGGLTLLRRRSGRSESR
jgi:T5SS/PEP-CTERM-associated repeat protein